MKTKNSDHVPVPADNHPAPGMQHQPPAGYLAHDLENGVEVNQTKGTSEFPPTRFYATKAALANQFPNQFPKQPATTGKDVSHGKAK